MAKLVIGTNKQTGVPAIVMDKSPVHYVEKIVDAGGVLQNSTNIINLDGVGGIGDYVLYGQYYHVTFPANTNANLSGLTAISGYNACTRMFDTCTGLTSVELSDLTTLSGANACERMFNSCTGLTSANLSGLTTINGTSACYYMFSTCSGLTSVNLSSLTTISGSGACNYMFNSCTRLTSIDLSSVTTITGSGAFNYMFNKCTSLATVYIGGTTEIIFSTQGNQFANMFQNCTHNIDVYAPAANQAQIESFSGYPKFGATGTVTWHWRS
jgi:hypothetical protein